jgi:hypothetical protein
VMSDPVRPAPTGSAYGHPLAAKCEATIRWDS